MMHVGQGYAVAPLPDHLKTKANLPGWVYSSLYDIGRARQTQRLWRSKYGSQRVIYYSAPDIAPTATITSADTAYVFKLGDASFSLPWFLQQGHDRIRAYVYVATRSSGVSCLVTRLTAATLVTAIASTVGTWQMTDTSNNPTLPYDWTQFDAGYHMGAAFLEITPTELPASRRVELNLHAALNPSGSEIAPDVSYAKEIKLVSAAIMDVPKGLT